MVASKNIYILRGKESYFKNKYLQKIKKHYENKSGWTDSRIYYADQDNVLRIEEDLSLFPGFNQTKIHIIKNIDKLPKNSRKAFLFFLNQLNFKSIIVLITSENNLNPEFIKKIALFKNSKIIECFPLKRSGLNEWILAEFKEKGSEKASKEVVEALIEKNGSDLWALDKEIEKLIVYKKGESIKKDDVEAIASKNVIYDVFALIDCLCSKDVASALKILKEMFFYGIPAEKIIGAVTWQLEKMIEAKILLKKNIPSSEIINILGINRYFSNKFMIQVNNFNFLKLRNLLKELACIDYKLKTSYNSAEFDLEMFIAGLVLKPVSSAWI